METKSLTGLRFVAALIIVNFHYGKETEFTSLAKQFLTSGPMMVTFFFVLSGFVLTYAYLKREHFSTQQYLAARIARILPLYFLALAISLALQLSLFELNRFDLIHIFISASLLQAWFPPLALEFNGPAWAISVQMFFYLLFPLIIIYLRRIKPKVSSVWILSISIHLLAQLVVFNLINSDFIQPSGSISHSLVTYFPLAHLGSFLVGVAAGYYAHHSPRYLEKGNRLFWTISGGLSLVFLFLLLNNRLFTKVAGYRTPITARLLVPTFLLLIFLFIHQKNYLRLIFQSKAFILLGEASYALYILQSPLYKLHIRYLVPALGLEGSIIFYIYLLLMVIISVLVHLGIELPAKKWITKLLHRPPKLTGSGVPE